MKVTKINDIERCQDEFQDVFTVTFTIDLYPQEEFVMVIDNNSKESYFWWIIPHRDKAILIDHLDSLKLQIFDHKAKTCSFRLKYFSQLNPW